MTTTLTREEITGIRDAIQSAANNLHDAASWVRNDHQLDAMRETRASLAMANRILSEHLSNQPTG